MKFRSYSFLLASALLACGGTAPTTPPKPSTPTVQKLPEGPARSGSDVRQVWVQTDGGGRVRFGDTLYAPGLSDRYGMPVYCAFGYALLDTRAVCIPNYGSALTWDAATGLYSDANCITPLVQEQPSWRACVGGKTLFLVTTFQTADGCSQSPLVSEAQPTTVATAYTRQLGVCRGFAVDSNARYYVMGKAVDSLLPRGSVGAE